MDILERAYEFLAEATDPKVWGRVWKNVQTQRKIRNVHGAIASGDRGYWGAKRYLQRRMRRGLSDSEPFSKRAARKELKLIARFKQQKSSHRS